MRKTWRSRVETDRPAFLADWSASLCISPLLAGLLWQRGLRTLEDMDGFLCPGLKHLMNPASIPGLTQAAEVVADHLGSGKTVAVWGDYDVDGVTSTALLVSFLRLRGYAARSHIPARLEDGYGLNMAGLEALKESGVDLVLTVDCGISAVAEAKRARELGLGLVITDHHLPGPVLPDALAVANPKIGPSGPGDDLAGVGVAFFLAAALNRLLPGPPVDIRQFLDLAALGTLADVVSLTGQNRILVKNGLLLVAEAKRPGIMALKEVSGFEARARLESSQVAFGLAPRINAAGRLGLASEALDLLLADDLAAARPLAASLDSYNVKRRQEEERISLEALEQAKAQTHLPAMVLCGADWHPGVIGIVASRVVEAHYRPALVLAADNGKLKGSGRSIPEFDLHGGLAACADLLHTFGGHHQAAGLSLSPDNLDALRERFCAHVATELGLASLSPTLKLDGELAFADIHLPLLKELDLLSPFGCANPEPVFCSPAVRVKNRKDFGKGHVFLDVRDEACGVTFRAKAWRMAERLGDVSAGSLVRLAFSPKLDTYNGLASIELRLKDWCDPG